MRDLGKPTHLIKLGVSATQRDVVLVITKYLDVERNPRSRAAQRATANAEPLIDFDGTGRYVGQLHDTQNHGSCDWQISSQQSPATLIVNLHNATHTHVWS